MRANSPPNVCMDGACTRMQRAGVKCQALEPTAASYMCPVENHFHEHLQAGSLKNYKRKSIVWAIHEVFILTVRRRTELRSLTALAWSPRKLCKMAMATYALCAAANASIMVRMGTGMETVHLSHAAVRAGLFFETERCRLFKRRGADGTWPPDGAASRKAYHPLEKWLNQLPKHTAILNSRF